MKFINIHFIHQKLQYSVPFGCRCNHTVHFEVEYGLTAMWAAAWYRHMLERVFEPEIETLNHAVWLQQDDATSYTI
jgi:hypothetical protein